MKRPVERLWQAKRQRDLARLHMELQAVLAAGEQVVIVDTETTHLGGELVEIAVRSLHGPVLLNTLVRPQGPLHPSGVHCHGITAATIAVAQARAWPEVYPQVARILAGRQAVAYNAPADQQAIHYTNELYAGLPPLTCWWYDLQDAYAVFRGAWQPAAGRYADHRLEHALRECGLDWQGITYHRAAGDTEAARRLLWHIAVRLQQAEGADHARTSEPPSRLYLRPVG